MSFNSNVILWNDFYEDFINNFNNINPIFVMINDIEIVYIGFTKLDNKYFININVNPSFRGKKYGQYSLNIALIYLKINYNLDSLYAYVKYENHISNKLFKKANFNLIKNIFKNNTNVYLYIFLKNPIDYQQS